MGPAPRLAMRLQAMTIPRNPPAPPATMRKVRAGFAIAAIVLGHVLGAQSYTYSDLGAFQASAINDAGTIVGYATTADTGGTFAYVYNNGVLTNLGVLA